MQKTGILILMLCCFCLITNAQLFNKKDTTNTYKKRVLENIEIDILSSLYTQDGENAAVSGGIGTEDLQDATATIVIAIPLTVDDVLTIDAGVSAYTSASSSNVNPFDSRQPADPFVASSGESRSDVWSSGNINWSHSSDDRNKVYSAGVSFAAEYDYTSVGVNGSFAKLFNQKNTEVSIKASAYFDTWSLIYPKELRGASRGDDDEPPFNLQNETIAGNPNYSPNFERLNNKSRNSYSVGFGFSQILSKKLQGSLALDLVMQHGQLSAPFQRVYFTDVADSFIENFHLADDIERLPNNRYKVALGGRLNYYLNEFIVLRIFYRYYNDSWKLQSHTAQVELPIKLWLGKITFYPSYRFYNQSAAAYFAPYNQHLSTNEFYTSDYDLGNYNAHQLGFGASYTDLLNSLKLWKISFHSTDLKYYYYTRNSPFRSHLLTLGVKFKI